MSPLISVIVPIYNVEKYLSKCIDSILNQTYKNLEIILVDDGSPDNCPAICDEYAEKDSRIIVVHKENGGLSDARNEGLKIAKGEYFYFVDSDDLLPVKSIETVYSLATDNNAQMVIAGFERFYDDGEVFFSTDSEGEYIKIMNRQEVMKDFYRDGCQAWAVLYHRSVHKDIYFPKGEINEDEAIVFFLFERCDTAVVTNKVVYTYRCRPDSITTTSFSSKKLIWQEHCRKNLEFIREKYPELEPYALKRYRGSLLWTLSEIAMSNENFSEDVEKMKSELKKNRKDFKKLDFPNFVQKGMFYVATDFPFWAFKMLFKLKQKIRGNNHN